ncbi:unnamed protein product [Caenorhabditis auriculariae]|uniref:Domain of unknown function DB domain-containing protein n=1 Tax=Caenorhabditis auriculariae TaxID=2777116 RepID=A0A8S1H876_9PELO|nr:unnamed protein product [Caenorhabditis auriculariae]
MPSTADGFLILKIQSHAHLGDATPTGGYLASPHDRRSRIVRVPPMLLPTILYSLLVGKVAGQLYQGQGWPQQFSVPFQPFQQPQQPQFFQPQRPVPQQQFFQPDARLQNAQFDQQQQQQQLLLQQQQFQQFQPPQQFVQPQPQRTLPTLQQPQQEVVYHHNVRSIDNFNGERMFFEQPQVFQQEKITLLAKPPPPPTPPPRHIYQQQNVNFRVPEPPPRFIPQVKDLFGAEGKHLVDKNAQYKPQEILVDGHHAAYFENTARTQPAESKTRIQSAEHGTQGGVTPDFKLRMRVPELPPPQPPKKIVIGPVLAPPATRNRVTTSQTSRPQRPVQKSRRPAPAAKKVPATSHLAAPVPAAAAGTPNEKFLSCCKKRSVDKSCERICSFDVLNKKTLTGMFLGTDPCPQSNGLDLLQCAADNDDHTQCCIERDVTRTSAGNKCLGFCNMKPGVTFQADVSMLPCWSVLNDIKQCFKENLERL